MKKFINDVALVEDQMIQGMVKAYPGYLRKLDCGNVVVRANKKEGKVEEAGTNRLTADTWDAACWTRLWPAQCSHRLPRTRFMRESRPLPRTQACSW